MEAIGGYFELADRGEGKFPHAEGILLNTGRNALEYILRTIPDVKGIYLPYYTCKVILEPIKKLGIPFAYYHINKHFEISDEIRLRKGEYIIANNYYGIKDAYIKAIAERYGERLIVDCAQAFFAKPIQGIKCFYSTRKYVGVCDGGIAYTWKENDNGFLWYDTDDSSDRWDHLYIRKQHGAEAGFKTYQENETKLDNQPIRQISPFTRDILNHIDYDLMKFKRRENYAYLHASFKEQNYLVLPEKDSFECPMIYPFVDRINRNLRQELISQKIYVAKYWPNVEQYRDFQLEVGLAQRLIAIPCDQRYVMNDMDRIIRLLQL